MSQIITKTQSGLKVEIDTLIFEFGYEATISIPNPADKPYLIKIAEGIEHVMINTNQSLAIRTEQDGDDLAIDYTDESAVVSALQNFLTNTYPIYIDSDDAAYNDAPSGSLYIERDTLGLKGVDEPALVMYFTLFDTNTIYDGDVPLLYWNRFFDTDSFADTRFTRYVENAYGDGGLIIRLYGVKNLTLTTAEDSNGFNNLEKLLDFAGCITSIISKGSEDGTGDGSNLFKVALTTVYLKGLQTSMVHNLFKNCTSLTGVKLPSLETMVGYGQFWNCTSLRELSLPQLSNRGNYPYYGKIGEITTQNLCKSCSSLIKFHAPKMTVIAAQDFMGCTALSDTNFDKVTQIYPGAFNGCTGEGLTNLSFPKLTHIFGSKTFQSCTNLHSIYLPLLQSIEEAPQGPGEDGPNLAGYNFADCPSLLQVNYPKLQNLPEYCFFNDNSLQSAILSRVTSISEYCFDNCTSLNNISLPILETIGRSNNSSSNNFKDIVDLSITLKINPIILTINDGDPHPDIQTLMDNNTVTIV